MTTTTSRAYYFIPTRFTVISHTHFFTTPVHTNVHSPPDIIQGSYHVPTCKSMPLIQQHL